jgi:hypothetical protein
MIYIHMNICICIYMYELYYALEACEEFDIYTPPVVPKKRISKRVSMVFICLLIKYV